MAPDDVERDRSGDEPARGSSPTAPAAGGRAVGDVTRILSRIEGGDGKAAEELLPLVYEELRKRAAQKMAQENPGQTLQATALVHEAYFRLVDADKVQHWNSRTHFFAAAADAMRDAGLPWTESEFTQVVDLRQSEQEIRSGWARGSSSARPASSR